MLIKSSSFVVLFDDDDVLFLFFFVFVFVFLCVLFFVISRFFDLPILCNFFFIC